MNECTENQCDELLCCPSCGLTKDKYDEWNKKWERVRLEWDEFKPIVYRDRLLGEWVIECQNCRFTAIFWQSEKEENIELWNELARMKSNDGKEVER